MVEGHGWPRSWRVHGLVVDVVALLVMQWHDEDRATQVFDVVVIGALA